MKTIGILVALTISLFAAIDINHASDKELTKLSGIGSKKAASIVEYRTNVKCFDSIDELTKVKGIGKKFVEKNMNNIELMPCSEEK